MPETLLCIHIEHNKLTATVTEATGQVIQLLHAVQIDIEDSLGASLKNLLAQLAIIPDKSIVSISHTSIGFHTLYFPFHDRKKINQVLQHELEEQTSHQLDDHFSDIHINKQDDATSRVVISLIEKTALLETLSTVQLAGIDPELITIAGTNGCRLNCQLKDEKEEEGCCYIYVTPSVATITVSQADQLILVRQLYHPADKNEVIPAKALAQQIKQTLISIPSSEITSCRFLLSGHIQDSFTKIFEEEFKQKIEIFSAIQQPLLKALPDAREDYEKANADDALCQAINYHRKTKPFFNFRSGKLAKKRNHWKKPKLLILAAAILFPLSIGLSIWAWFDYSAMERKRDSLKAERNAVFRQTLPEVKRIVNPVQQLEVLINQTKDNGGTASAEINNSILELLTELSATISPQYSVILTRLIAEQNNVRLKGIAKDFNTVDTLHKALEKSDYFSRATINSANLNSKKNKVLFELKLTIGEQP